MKKRGEGMREKEEKRRGDEREGRKEERGWGRMKKRGKGMRENEEKRRGDEGEWRKEQDTNEERQRVVKRKKREGGNGVDLQVLLGGPGDDVLEVSEGVRATCTCIQQN